MTRLSYLVGLFLLISPEILGQCVNPATITLSSTIGNICGIGPVTVGGNTFGGSAAFVIITENGHGSVNSSYATSSPFTFTYTPGNGDLGKNIVITITTNDPPGRSCRAAKVTYTLSVNDIPSAPVRGPITQPDCHVPTGSVVLNGLPDDGGWSLTSNPGGTSLPGSGTSATFTGLAAGNYTFIVSNSAGCMSAMSENVAINMPPPVPTLMITDPDPVCFPSTVNLTISSITAGSDAGLTFTYWRNDDATRIYFTPLTASDGTYYIKGTASNGCSDIKPVQVTVKTRPDANAGPDKVLKFVFKTNLEALSPGIDETGTWSVFSGSGMFSDSDDARVEISDLALGNNIFLWSVTNGACPPSVDTVNVTVLDLVIPTLITPNMDGKNDYLVIGSKEMTQKMELVIFNRRGIEVYKNLNYDNTWNGLDYNGDPLPADTYFYLLKFENGRTASGYVVIRR